MANQRFYVEYLGWKQAQGLFGREFTEHIVRELLARRRLNAQLPRMTLKVNHKDIQISEEKASKNGGKPEKLKYPSIPTKDCSFVIQGLYPDTDVVACIFLGYNPSTKCAIHVHVYRFDSEATAAMFVQHLQNIIDRPEYRERILGIEKDLHDLGAVTLRKRERQHQGSRNSDGMSYGTTSPYSSDSLSPKYPSAEEALKERKDIQIEHKPRPEPDQKTKRLFNSLQEELDYKLSLEDTPILLPPKDYDTIVRRHGHLEIREELKSVTRSIVGPNNIFSQSSETEPYLVNIDEASSSSSGKTTSEGNDHQANGQSDASSTRDRRNGYRVVRSSSDNSANLLRPPTLQRQHSQASSDRGSNNSDDYYADGLYQGYRPSNHKRTTSRDDGYNSSAGDEMSMWSPNYSFGQTSRNLSTHHEEDHGDPLLRTAPAGMLPRKEIRRTSAAEHDYRTNGRHADNRHVKRSHSQRDGGRSYR